MKILKFNLDRKKYLSTRIRIISIIKMLSAIIGLIALIIMILFTNSDFELFGSSKIFLTTCILVGLPLLLYSSIDHSAVADNKIDKDIEKLTDERIEKFKSKGSILTNSIKMDTLTLSGRMLLYDHEQIIIGYKTKKTYKFLNPYFNYVLHELSIKYSEIKNIAVLLSPRHISTKSDSDNLNYTIGGAMVGGVAGVIVGSVLDDIKSSTKNKSELTTVEISIELKLKDKSKYKFYPFRRNLLLDETNEGELKKIHEPLIKLRRDCRVILDNVLAP